MVAQLRDEVLLKNWLREFMKVIRNPHDCKLTILPGSVKETTIFNEVFYLFARLCRLNSKFKKLIILDSQTSSMNYILIYYLVDLFQFKH